MMIRQRGEGGGGGASVKLGSPCRDGADLKEIGAEERSSGGNCGSLKDDGGGGRGSAANLHLFRF